MADAPLFQRAAILGVGLIGSSLARAMRERRLAREVVGYDLNPDAAVRAAALDAVDLAAPSLSEAVKEADLVVLSTPVGAMGPLLGETAAAAAEGALIIDVGSVKEVICKAAETPDVAGSGAFIVPCHPVAGTEQSGPEAGFPTLFEGRWCILTPLDRQDAAYGEAVDKAAALWRAVGSEVEVMDPALHDLALAVTSHLPHLIAFTLVGAADDLETVTEAEIVKYSAGGFRDFTRIAASDPIMWRDVFLHNRGAVLEVLGRFTEELALLQRAIRWGDAETLERTFARGRSLRRAIVEAGQETAAPDFGRGRKAREDG